MSSEVPEASMVWCNASIVCAVKRYYKMKGSMINLLEDSMPRRRFF